MKTFISLGLLWLSFLQAYAEPLTNVVSAATNTLAFYLVAEDVSGASLTAGTATLEVLRLKSQPILADSDFVAWDVTNHTFVITPTAAKRVAGSCSVRIIPFVLFAGGEQIYCGKFTTLTSSASEDVPVILTDSIVTHCFMGNTNVPGDVWRMMGCADPMVTDRLMALTNATTNVTLQIDQRYLPPDGFWHGTDRRGDKRIAVAVEKLFGSREK